MAKTREDLDDGNTERFELRVSPLFTKQVDDWRRRQPDVPTRAEAVRRMVAIVAKDRRK
jgi:hypothetical protein